jgi:hypothetical protein
VQVGSIKAVSKAPGTKRLKLNYDELLSSFAFKFNVRRYKLASFCVVHRGAICAPVAGAYTRPLLSSTLAVSDTKHTIDTP